MAARGMSNGDIAQALFVTVKTVEMHLGRAYRKLDLAERSQLAAALSERAIAAESELASRIAGPMPTQV